MFGPNVFSSNFRVNILPNLRDDGDRSFTVALSAPTGGATLGSPSTATIAIKNNDVAGAVQFSAASTGQIHFNAAQLSTTIRIPLQIELGAQPLKTFRVILGNPRGGATLGAQSSAEVRITDTR